jgi:hypothetical protein
MNDDIKENISKIIDAKLKQIKIQSEFYENKIRTEVKRVIEIEDKIKKLKFKIDEKSNKDADDNQVRDDIVQNEFKIIEIKKIINQLRVEKKNVLGCDINVEFYDDQRI